MLRYTCFNGMLEVKTSSYSVKKGKDSPFLMIRTGGIENILDLKIALALDEKQLELAEAKELCSNGHRSVNDFEITFAAGQGPKMHLHFFEDRIETRVENVGNTRVVNCFAGSLLNCDVVFNPAVDVLSEHYFNVRMPQRTSPALFSPPPWFLAYRQRNGKWASSALEPGNGELDFYDFGTRPGKDQTMSWDIDMGVPPEEELPGRSTPPLVFRFDDENEFAALQKHASHVAASGKIQRPDRRIEPWHKGILACGWRFQTKVPRPAECTQANYQAYIDMLDNHDIPFDTLIVDDFWGKEYGIWREDKEKWPDLRAFIDQLHARGKHLLLWICILPDGLPEGERCGKSVNANSPAWRLRVRESMRYLLSDADGCLNADGFKFDFTGMLPNAYPKGAPCRNMAFMHERFRIISEAARAVKEDCLLDYQCANPYFTSLQNMLRINDYFGLPESAMEEMAIRCRIGSIVSYNALIDTDHNSYRDFSYEFGEDYTLRIRAYGIPSLYLMAEDLKNPKLLKNLQSLKNIQE